MCAFHNDFAFVSRVFESVYKSDYDKPGVSLVTHMTEAFWLL